jgi:hypothetical protein
MSLYGVKPSRDKQERSWGGGTAQQLVTYSGYLLKCKRKHKII